MDELLFIATTIDISSLRSSGKLVDEMLPKWLLRSRERACTKSGMYLLQTSLVMWGVQYNPLNFFVVLVSEMRTFRVLRRDLTLVLLIVVMRLPWMVRSFVS